jgi:hypothetical protein
VGYRSDLIGRALGAAAAGTTAGIHLHLWLEGYRHLPTIGPLFLLNVVGGGLLAIALLATPRRWVAVTALAAAGYEVATLVALLISTTGSLFGFTETTSADLYWPSVAVESAGALVLLVLAARQAGEWRRRRRTPTGSMVQQRVMSTK